MASNTPPGICWIRYHTFRATPEHRITFTVPPTKKGTKKFWDNVSETAEAVDEKCVFVSLQLVPPRSMINIACEHTQQVVGFEVCYFSLRFITFRYFSLRFVTFCCVIDLQEEAQSFLEATNIMPELVEVVNRENSRQSLFELAPLSPA